MVAFSDEFMHAANHQQTLGHLQSEHHLKERKHNQHMMQQE